MPESEAHVEAYRELRPSLERIAGKIGGVLIEWLDDESINYLSVSARAKGVDSFAKKAAKCHADGRPRYTAPLDQITDLLGARVITYIPEAVNRVCEIVTHEFNVVEELDKGAETRARGMFGYASKHFLVRLDHERQRLPEYRRIGDRVFEIQVRTAVQHAWAEFEHDVRYKVAIPAEVKPDFDRRFLLAAALLEMADREFTEIDRMYRGLALTEPEPRVAPDTQPESEVDAEDRPSSLSPTLDGPGLTAYLSRHYPDAPRSKSDHYEWLVSVLATLGVTTTEELDRRLRDVPSERVAEAMGHQLPAGQIRRLDDDLLVALGERYAQASVHGSVNEASRLDLLRRRRERLVRSGFRFE